MLNEMKKSINCSTFDFYWRGVDRSAGKINLGSTGKNPSSVIYII